MSEEKKNKKYTAPGSIGCGGCGGSCNPGPGGDLGGFGLIVVAAVAICGVAVAGSAFFGAGYIVHRQIDTNYQRFFKELLGKDTESILFNIETMIERYEKKNSIYVNRIKLYFTLLDVFKNLNRMSIVLDGNQICILYEITEYLREQSDSNKKNIINKMMLYAQKGNFLDETIKGIPIITILIIILDIDFTRISDKKIKIEFKDEFNNEKNYSYRLSGLKEVFSVNKKENDSYETQKLILSEFRNKITRKMRKIIIEFNKKNPELIESLKIKNNYSDTKREEFIDELINLLKDCYDDSTINYTIRKYLENKITLENFSNSVKNVKSENNFTIFVIALLLGSTVDNTKFENEHKECEYLICFTPFRIENAQKV
jgi:hypothetical protein